MWIGELASTTGATPRSLRLYEAAGLIASTRASNGYRRYEPEQVVRVKNIRALLGAGLTLEDVGAFSACLDGDVMTAPPSLDGQRIARERLRLIDARIATQREARDRLAAQLDALGPETSPGEQTAVEAAGVPTPPGRPQT